VSEVLGTIRSIL